LPDEIARIDMGEAEADCSKLHSLIGEFPLTPLEETFRALVDYFREALR
jgi:nucleoside-diphosphate-sugar epimerase